MIHFLFKIKGQKGRKKTIVENQGRKKAESLTFRKKKIQKKRKALSHFFSVLRNSRKKMCVKIFKKKQEKHGSKKNQGI